MVFMNKFSPSSKKFSKKYLFLQNSLIDFLSWRSILLETSPSVSSRFSSVSLKKSHEKSKIFFPKRNQKNFYSLDSKKLTFQNYWQTSNSKKVQTLLSTFQKNRFLKKSQNSFQKSLFFNFSSNYESFLPEIDYFRNLNIFQNIEFGKFFPQKKLFQQYWIFPVFGFVLFFSSNFSCFQSEFQQYSKKKKRFSENFFFLRKSKFLQSSDENSKIKFFYSNKKNNFWYQQLKEVEQNEIQNIFESYFPIFENSKLLNSSIQLENLFKKNQFKQNFLQKNQNVFSWYWFSTSIPDSSPTFFQKLSFRELPQKAEFFLFDLNHQNFFEFEKTSTFQNQTPLFQFLKNRFFLTAFEQEQNVEKPLNFSFFDFLLEKYLFTERENNVSPQMFYLKKWFETQKFFSFKKFDHKSFQDQRKRNLFVKTGKSQNHFDLQKFNFLQDLDSIYFQKKYSFGKQDLNSLFEFSLPKMENLNTQATKPYLLLKKQTVRLVFLEYYLNKLKNFEQNPVFQKNFDIFKPIHFFPQRTLSIPQKNTQFYSIKKLELPLLFHTSLSEVQKNFFHKKVSNEEPFFVSFNFFSLPFSEKSFQFIHLEKKNLLFSSFFQNPVFENFFGDKKVFFFQKFSTAPLFERAFFCERQKNQGVQFFKNHKDLVQNLLNQRISKIPSIEFSQNQKKFFSISQKNFEIHAKQKRQFFGQMELQKVFQNTKKQNLCFHNRKFEKIFQTFFSPLSFQSFSGQKQQNHFFFKTAKDKFLLQNLKTSSSSFSDLNKFFLFDFQTSKIPKFEFQKNTRRFRFSQKLKNEIVSPTFLLKREGFIHLPKTPFQVEKYKNIQRFQKEKDLQKKRRLKKQKLETRRRKKRKRFYPRPIWLRFHLYKKFLQIRHPTNKSSVFRSKTEKNLYSENLNKFRKVSKFHFQKTLFETSQLYSKSWKIHFSEFPSFLVHDSFSKKFFNAKPMSQNSENYKLSSDLLSDFLRFSWKSSWFQQNYQTYKKNLSDNFVQMKTLENQKVFQELFVPSSIKFSKDLAEKTDNEFLLKASLAKKFMWYRNIQNSFQSEEVEKNFLFSSNYQIIPEYNKLLYARLGERLKTLKLTENSEEIFSKSFQLPPYRLEANFSNLSFFTKFALFFENFTIPSQPTIPAFSLFSNIFQNVSEKPTGEGPTLRALWAFQKTNFSHFQETNLFRTFWTKRKKIESLKSFKGMKNLLRFVESSNTLEKFQNLQTISSANSSFFLRQKFQEKPGTLNPVFQKENFKIQSSDFFEQLDRVTLQKFLSIQKKCLFYGIHSLQQNSKLSLRYLKFHLISSKKDVSFQNEFDFFSFSPLHTSKIENQQNSSVSSLNFWWNQKKPNMEYFLSQTKDKPFEEMIQTPFFTSFVDDKKGKVGTSTFFENQVLFFATFLFHIALFLTFLKIPQIRSLLKFQFLIFSKFFSATFFLIFSISQFLQESIDQGKNLFSLFSTKHFSNDFFSEDFFSRKNYLEIQKIHYFDEFFETQNIGSKFPMENIKQSFFFEFFVRVSPFSTTQTLSKWFQMFSKIAQSSDSFILFSPVFQNFKNSISPSEKSFGTRKNVFFPKPIQFSLKNFQQENMISFQTFDLFSQKPGKQRLFSSSFQGSFPQLFRSSLFIKDNIFRSTSSLNQGVQLSSVFGVFLSNTERGTHQKNIVLFEMAMVFLNFAKSSVEGSSLFLQFSSQIFGKFFDVFEFFFFTLYKFLEKPAELIIEWIALAFLIEWSSDIPSFLPDTYDNFLWKSSQKLFRPLQASNFFLNFSFFSPSSQTILAGGIDGVPLFFGFQYTMITSFMFKKKFFSLFENFLDIALQPDIDILTRQRKGMIFWDIWAEILLKAAEKYNVNIPSFVTLKEEQELFLEKLLQDPKFLESLSSSTFDQNFSVFTETFFLPDRPKKFFDSHFFQQKTLPISFQQEKNQEKISKLSLFHFFFSALKEMSFENQIALQRKSNQSSSFERKTEKDQFKHLSSIFFFNFLQNPNENISETLQQIQDRWSCIQYGISQGSETDLFIDIHPPKSFEHIKFFQYYDPGQFLIGSLMCQLSAGIFPKQISKNILVIGELGTAKTLFLQALAGESEMKILTDNAYRYASVQKGVAVGMKYLRDVFDSIALQTPCFFVMEHIHVIGAKRPFLISDEDNLKDAFFGSEQQEVHESNQLIYQLTRHSLTDFKRPYKGDFAMGIPTNFFLQNFYSQFPKHTTTMFQNSVFSGGRDKNSRSFLHSPLPLESIEQSLQNQSFQSSQAGQSSNFLQKRTQTFPIQSFLQLSKEQIFAPPATSPFTVFMLKEQKKLKPFKTVQEFSWGGLAPDQIMSYQKESYSIRSKVAILADITLNLSRGKLDMITDLLVIIDSVRANRGFIVFATTHLPALLDPALRRPGRFDETLSLAQSPNFLNRFELLKMHFQTSLSTLDFFNASLLTENCSELDLLTLINATKLSFFHSYKMIFPTDFSSSKHSSQKLSKRLFSQKNPTTAFFHFLKSPLFANFYTQQKEKGKNSILSKFSSSKSLSLLFSSVPHKKNESTFFIPFLFGQYNTDGMAVSFLRTLAYSKIGTFVYESQSFCDPSSFSSLGFDLQKLAFSQRNVKNSLAALLYNSQEEQKNQLNLFLSGKILEFFSEKNILVYSLSPLIKDKTKTLSCEILKRETTLDSFQSSEIFLRKFSSFLNDSKNLSLPNSQSVLYPSIKNIQFLKKQNFWTTVGTDDSWRFATPFLVSLLQKRFFFTKNLFLSKMLFFENKNQRRQPPSPPNSSILMPSKKYENFKRTEFDFSQKPFFSMNEKIQLHQKQRFLKQLYNVKFPLTYASQRFQNHQTSFTSAFSELAYFENFLERMSSTHFYQRKYFTIRHNFSHINLWWNAMFPEHNAETTYLSDVDWRTMFVSHQEIHNVAKNSKLQTIEFTMDFPDSEQYYNPRNRRWYFSKKNAQQNGSVETSALLPFDLELQYEIYYHFFMEAFHQNFEYFDKKREIVDFFVFELFQKGLFQEFDFLSIFTRFYLFSK